jgi:hypothetical protein
MAQDTESFNNELYNLLKVRGYKPTPLNSQNQRVGASQEADVIEFTFTKDGEDYGKVWVSVDNAANVIIYYDEEQQESPSNATPGMEYDDTWTGLLKFIKAWSQRRQLSFELANKDRLGDDMRQRDYYRMKEKLGESYHSMGKKASYNDAVPNVKIVLQHNRALEEGEARFRNVSRIFLENQDGERFLAPTTKPGIARVYARHIAEGGVPNDDRWNHIKTVCEDYSKMAGFVRATRNKEFNESAQDLINEGASHYTNLRETLHKLTGHRGYHAYFESWTPSLMEDEGEDLAINELFVQETVDPRIESVMPILSKLRKNVAEMSEVDTLAEWADSIISEKLEMDSTTKSMAVPADEMLDEAPGAETLSHNQSTEKSNLKAFGLAEEDDDKVVSIKSRKKPFIGALAKDFDDEFGHYDELGRIGKLASINRGAEDDMDWDDDSWIPDEEDFEHEEMAKELSRHRGRFAANDLKEMDKESGSKRDFDNARGPDKTAKMMAAKDAVKAARKTLDKAFRGDVDENFIGMSPQAVAEEEVDESGLQAYLGKKKYGEKGMKALQQAGRDGASKEKMATIRAKHDKLDEVEMEEGLDANQKRVGQLGPTEKVKNNNIGKLVGANESKEIPAELARIIEMAKFKR